MKAFTDIEQSRKLAEILPLESADMCFNDNEPCWSLAALLEILPDGTDVVKGKADTKEEKYMCTVGIKKDIISTFADNPVDACYEMILKLHELKVV